MYELSLQGYEFRRIEEEQENIPKEILQRFQNRAWFEDNRWENEDEDMIYNTAFIAVRNFRDEKDPSKGFSLLKSEWHQRNPYNNSLNGDLPLGCVTVAVGQIMRYHKHPATFNWADIPDKGNYDISRNESTLSKFLRKIHDELGVDNDGGAKIDDAEKVLKSYGYHVKQIDHKTGVYEKYPTYCRGFSNSLGFLGDGHAWVCDGESYLNSGAVYELYVLDCAYYPKFKFYKIDEERKQTSYKLYHMNWGWGKYNGLYFDGSLNLSIDGENKNFNHLRKDLVISKP